MKFSIVLFLILLAAESQTKFIPHFLTHLDPLVEQQNVDRFLNKITVFHQLQAKVFGINLPPSAKILKEDSDENQFAVEGDILLSEKQLDRRINHLRSQIENPRTRPKRSFVEGEFNLWPIPVPYQFNFTSGVGRAVIMSGIYWWQNNTCVRFEEKTSAASRLVFESSGPDCLSSVGKLGDAIQKSYLPQRCWVLGSVIHELGHSLGCWHEQSRSDRDEYVNINLANLESPTPGDFYRTEFSEMNGYGVGYDHGSIMHYGPVDMALDYSQHVMTTVDPNYQMTIGQVDEPSFADIKRMNAAYCSAVCESSPPITCQNKGYPDPNNCSRCKCPPAFSGAYCQSIKKPVTDCGGFRTANSAFATMSIAGNVLCYWVITSPPNTQIRFDVKEMTIISPSTNVYEEHACLKNYLEINYLRDFTYSGARFCNGTLPTILRSQSNSLIVTYKGHSGASFKLDYRYV